MTKKKATTPPPEKKPVTFTLDEVVNAFHRAHGDITVATGIEPGHRFAGRNAINAAQTYLFLAKLTA